MIELSHLLDHPRAPVAQVMTSGQPARAANAVALTLPVGATSIGVLTEQLDHNPTLIKQAMITILANDVPMDWKVDLFLKQAAAAGASWLICDPIGGMVPAATTRLADRFGLALISCREPAAFHSLCQAYMSAEQRTADTRALDIVRIASNELRLEQAITLMEAKIGRQLQLFDASGHVVRGHLPSGLARELRKNQVFRNSPGVRCIRLDSDRMLLLAPVITDLPTTFWLAVSVAPDSLADRTTLSDLLEAAALVCAHTISRSRVLDETGAQERKALIDELVLCDPEQPRVELRRRVADLGWSFEVDHSVLRISCSAAVDVIDSTRVVRRAFADRNRVVTIAEADDGWFVWAPTTSPAARKSFENTAREVNRELRVLRDTSCGLSSVRQGIGGFIRSLTQATDAARVAWNRPQAGYFAVADDLGFDQLLLSWTSADTFASTTGELLHKLDAEGSALKSTLLTYLDAESSLTETAAVLDIHRNTVAERIRRIERVLNVSLKDPETRLALHLATRAELRFHT